MRAGVRSAIRSRLTLGRITLAAVLAAGVLAFGPQLEQDDAGAPPDHAAKLVPAEALAYVHLSIDRASEQWKNATALARRVPRVMGLRNRLLRSLTLRGGALDLEREVYPWVGEEAAFALLASDGATARSLILVEVSDRDLARSFLSRAVGRVRRSLYRGTTIRVYGELATAFLDDFLLIGQPENVRAAIDTRHARLGSLASSPSFLRARNGLPDTDRLLYAYASPGGLRHVLRTRGGLLGRLAQLADDRSLLGAAAALRAEQTGARIDFASTLSRAEPGRSRRDGGERFVPALLRAIPGDAIAYLGMRGADRIFESIESITGGTPLRLPLSLERSWTQHSRAGGRSIRRALEPLLDKEAALFVSPSSSDPVVTLMVDHVGGQQAGRLIERLQPLVSSLIERPAEGQVPTFRSRRIAGIDAASLRITPTLELTYSVFGGRAVVSTAARGIRNVKSAESRITDTPLFKADLEDGFDRATAVLFLDLEQLLAVGEQAGLSDTPGYRAIKADLTRVSAVSAITSSTRKGNKAAIFIEVQ